MPLLEQLDPDAKDTKDKSKNLPRGDYLEFVRLVSVSFIAVLNSIFVNNAKNFFTKIINDHSFYSFPDLQRICILGFNNITNIAQRI